MFASMWPVLRYSLAITFIVIAVGACTAWRRI